MGVVVLCVLQLRAILERGPIRLAAPRTVVSNAAPPLPAAEPYLEFLGRVRDRVPAGVSISIRSPRDVSDTLIAVGQLPGQRVLPPYVAGSDFIVVYGIPFHDEGYGLVLQSGDGSLYRRW